MENTWLEKVLGIYDFEVNVKATWIITGGFFNRKMLQSLHPQKTIILELSEKSFISGNSLSRIA